MKLKEVYVSKKNYFAHLENLVKVMENGGSITDSCEATQQSHGRPNDERPMERALVPANPIPPQVAMNARHAPQVVRHQMLAAKEEELEAEPSPTVLGKGSTHPLLNSLLWCQPQQLVCLGHTPSSLQSLRLGSEILIWYHNTGSQDQA